MNKKLKIGIDINETLRAKWLQFDRFYVTEFGEEGVPEEPYVYDFFKHYKWEDRKEVVNILKEDAPEDINPKFYQVDEKTGEAQADPFLFKKEEHELTAKEVYNKFMYEDFLFEIYGSAPIMYKNMDVDLKKFFKKYSNHVDFFILSKENWFSIPPTLFFLSKCNLRFKNYKFCESNVEMWEDVDVLITTDPELLTNIPENKKVVKLKRPYNQDIENDFDLLHINDLIENKEFQKIINYEKKDKKDE